MGVMFNAMRSCIRCGKKRPADIIDRISEMCGRHRSECAFALDVFTELGFIRTDSGGDVSVAINAPQRTLCESARYRGAVNLKKQWLSMKTLKRNYRRTTMDLKQTIRNIPDFPKEGILFRDITTLLKDADAYEQLISELADSLKAYDVDIVIGPGQGVRHRLGARLCNPCRIRGRKKARQAPLQDNAVRIRPRIRLRYARNT